MTDALAKGAQARAARGVLIGYSLYNPLLDRYVMFNLSRCQVLSCVSVKLPVVVLPTQTLSTSGSADPF